MPTLSQMDSQIPELLGRTVEGKMSRLGVLKQMGHSRSKVSLAALSKAINGLCLDGVVEKIGGHSICLAGDAQSKRNQPGARSKDQETSEKKQKTENKTNKTKKQNSVTFSDESEKRKQTPGNISEYIKKNPKELVWLHYLHCNLASLMRKNQENQVFDPMIAKQCQGQTEQRMYLHYDHELAKYVCKTEKPVFEDVYQFMYLYLVPFLHDYSDLNEADTEYILPKHRGSIARLNKRNSDVKKAIEVYKAVIDKYSEKQAAQE